MRPASTVELYEQQRGGGRADPLRQRQEIVGETQIACRDGGSLNRSR
jgi:hypothetical protein